MTAMRPLLARPVPAALFILVAVVLDQVIKYLVEIWLPFQEAVPVIPYLALYRTWNEGVAFSFLSGMSGWAIVGMRLLIVGFILWWWRSASQTGALMHLGFAMIVAGAIGNIVDRFIYGHVVDYVLFHTETWSFAVFNLADSLITVGAVIVGFSELFLQRGAPRDAS
ncbi:MAG: signal peptidase [Rhizobium sp.]|nr:signal peptidase [Rhizobium sp.]